MTMRKSHAEKSKIRLFFLRYKFKNRIMQSPTLDVIIFFFYKISNYNFDKYNIFYILYFILFYFLKLKQNVLIK